MSSAKSKTARSYTDYSEACLGHWKLSDIVIDGANSYAPDSGPKKYHLIADTTPSAGILATSGRATFDGTGDYFKDIINQKTELQFSKDKDPTHSATVLPSLIISANVNTSSTGTTRAIIGCKGITTNLYGAQLIMYLDGTFGLTWRGPVGNTTQLCTSTINDGVDHHVVIILDRTNDKQQYYLDGTLTNVDKAINAQLLLQADTDAATTPEFNIGANSGGTGHWSGDMWGVQVYTTYGDITALKTRAQLVAQLATGYLTRDFL